MNTETETKLPAEHAEGAEKKPVPDTGRIKFTVRTRTYIYSDHRKFCEYRIEMWLGAVCVGVIEAPRRTCAGRAEAIKRARERVRELKARRLFVVHVRKEDIANGTGRSCSTCAISQALWHNQERMGFEKNAWEFRTETYAAWQKSDGIVLTKSAGRGEKPIHIAPRDLPSVVTNYRREGVRQFYAQEMVEWTMGYDEWEDSRHLTLKQWREEQGAGAEDDPLPCRPRPCFFVLDMDAFKPLEAA